jgi:hypothetical protein
VIRHICGLALITCLSILSVLQAQPKNIKSAQGYAIGTWIGSSRVGELTVLTKCVLNGDGRVVAYSQPATADGWSSPTWSGTWKAGSEKQTGSNRTDFYIEFTVKRSEILEVGKKIKLTYVGNDLVSTSLHLRKGDKDPFTKTPAK